ncbi:MAG: hypothetical protein GY720_18045 [bacterium]|nr:hypothetical protein [bacterium]
MRIGLFNSQPKCCSGGIERSTRVMVDGAPRQKALAGRRREDVIDTERTASDERELRLFWTVVAIASAAAGVSVVAGVALWIADPAEGTTPEGLLGFTAAVSGLLTGALFGAAAIYAQIKNLWRFAPRWFRYTAWAVMIVIAVVAIASAAARNP